MKVLRIFLALAFLASAQETLTNDSVAKMVKAGLGEGLIVSMIQNQPGKYYLDAGWSREAEGTRSARQGARGHGG